MFPISFILALKMFDSYKKLLQKLEKPFLCEILLDRENSICDEENAATFSDLDENIGTVSKHHASHVIMNNVIINLQKKVWMLNSLKWTFFLVILFGLTFAKHLLLKETEKKNLHCSYTLKDEKITSLRKVKWKTNFKQMGYV